MAIRANSVLGVLVAFLLLFFATVTNFMKKADVFSKNGRIGDGEKRVLELWMTSQQTPVMKVTKEQVFELAKAFATDELGWTDELDSFSARMITTVAEGLSSVELTTVTTGTSRKKLKRSAGPAGMKRLARRPSCRRPSCCRTCGHGLQPTATSARWAHAAPYSSERWRASSTRARATSSSRNGW